jgi:hypothetical protein
MRHAAEAKKHFLQHFRDKPMNWKRKTPYKTPALGQSSERKGTKRSPKEMKKRKSGRKALLFTQITGLKSFEWLYGVKQEAGETDSQGVLSTGERHPFASCHHRAV